MATIPTVPTFNAGDTSLLKLQQLSQAVSFLADVTTKPAFHVYKTSTQSITLNTWTIPSNTGCTIAYDNDNCFGGTAKFTATINTQGYWVFEGCGPWATTATGISARVSFVLTAGANNPNLAPAGTIRFANRGGLSTGTASTDTVLVSAAVSPIALYSGDTVAFQVWCDATTTLNINNNASFISGRFVTNFTGHWLRTAP